MEPKPSLTDLSRTIVENNRSGKTKADSVRMLRARGWPESSAKRFVHETIQAYTDDTASDSAAIYAQSVIVTRADASPLSLVLRVIALVGVGMMLLHMLSLLFP